MHATTRTHCMHTHNLRNNPHFPSSRLESQRSRGGPPTIPDNFLAFRTSPVCTFSSLIRVSSVCACAARGWKAHCLPPPRHRCTTCVDHLLLIEIRRGFCFVTRSQTNGIPRPSKHHQKQPNRACVISRPASACRATKPTRPKADQSTPRRNRAQQKRSIAITTLLRCEAVVQNSTKLPPQTTPNSSVVDVNSGRACQNETQGPPFHKQNQFHKTSVESSQCSNVN
jgi:hypothetical protein